MHQKTISTKR